jgi:hypothetical protein
MTKKYSPTTIDLMNTWYNKKNGVHACEMVLTLYFKARDRPRNHQILIFSKPWSAGVHHLVGGGQFKRRRQRVTAAALPAPSSLS